ncbi:MAG: TetR/AcrR family transcriptional regulator [Nocardioides sp.]
MTEDRRTAMAGAAIALLARGGPRVLTHRAIDAELGLPAGSTSYYLRTRRAVLEAVVTELQARARAAFQVSPMRPPDPAAPPSAAEAARLLAEHLDRTVAERPDDVRARHALLAELSADAGLRDLLRVDVVDRAAADRLCAALRAPEPWAAGHGLTALLDGLLSDRLVGRGVLDAPAPGTSLSRELFEIPIGAYLAGLPAGRC